MLDVRMLASFLDEIKMSAYIEIIPINVKDMKVLL
jgi:hypothetical protein